MMHAYFEALTRAGLLDDFYAAASMEPLPSGEFILEGLVVERDGGGLTYRHVAGDGAGGAFIVFEDGTFALVSSEGEAAVLGPDLRTAIATVISIYGWQDALRFAGGNETEVARAQWHRNRQRWGLPEGPEDPEAMEKIRQLLDLPQPEDPFGALCAAVASGRGLVFRAADDVFEPPHYVPFPE